MTQLLKQFANPSAAFRAKPFWSWNGRLEEDELVRQIHVFKEMGFGGFFMHSRTGLVTEYLGDEWFRLTNRCADEAARLGMEAWLYDEDRWPSGTAGGLVTVDPRHRQKFISLHFVSTSEFCFDDGILAAFTCRRDGLTVNDVRRLLPGEMPAANCGGIVLVFRIEASDPSSFYNGFTYVDTLSREATEAFLALTHDRYRERCGDRLGNVIRGIFTDEPHRGPVMCGFSLPNANRLWMSPWTESLFNEFQSAFGYELVDHLPELFLQVDGHAVSPVKWHYMELLQRLFLRNFAEAIYAWCAANNLQLTGHVLHEDTLTAQTCMQGSLMRFYEHMHLPGIDVLSEGNRNYWVAKQLSSVGRQLDKPWLLSELYGCTGWQMTFENYKAAGNWQALFGVNVRCPHLSWYTMEGEAKRDYPASISYQSAWHKEYKHVEDYFARLGVFLASGRVCCDLLVISPVESLWCQVHGGWADSLTPQDKAVRDLEQGYAELFQWLSGAQLDFDYGDEEMMSRLARVDFIAGEPVLRFGHSTYRAVIVGRMTTVRGTTLQLLKQLIDAGGRVVFAGEAPPFIDAVKNNAAVELSRQALRLPWSEADVIAACRDLSTACRVDVTDAAGRPVPNVFCQLRQDDDGQRYLVAMNMQTDCGPKGVRLGVLGTGSVVEFDCETGLRYAVPAVAILGGRIEWTVDFAASQSHAFVIGPKSGSHLAQRPLYHEKKRHTANGAFRFELDEPNVAVLDVARYQIDDGAWQPAAEVLRIDRAVRSAFGLPWRSGEMVQPWFRQRENPVPTVRGRVRLEFEFDAAVLPQSSVHLGIERPERVSVLLNGVPVDNQRVDGWWVDHAIQRLPLPEAALQTGANTITLEVDFHDGVDLEAIYLLGDFGVRAHSGRVSLTQLPDALSPTDLVEQGLPFYGGAIRYYIPCPSIEGEKLFLELPSMEAACAKVIGADSESRMLAWRPLRADITDLATSAGELTVEVILTRRNTFGPLHELPARTPHYGPDNFTTSGAKWSKSHVFYPSGLLAAPVWIESGTAPPIPRVRQQSARVSSSPVKMSLNTAGSSFARVRDDAALK